jgi:flagellar biosynthesis protein FlhF
MRVKRFVARSIQEAMVQVKVEMGQEAVILHTRKFKEGGFLGLFAQEFVEVTAAVDHHYPEIKKEEVIDKVVWPNLSKTEIKETSDTVDNIEETLSEDESSLEQDDLREMKQMMEDMMKQIEQASFNLGLNHMGNNIYKILVKNEVEPILARRIVKSTMEKIPPSQYEDLDFIREKMIERIARILKESKPIVLPKRKQQVFALVGPTGVGKTTTIAKLAANFAITSKKNVALITSDTYRIAAVEQLKAVGEVLGINVDVVFTPQSIKNAIASHRDKDVILIDTAGRNHRSMLHVSELKAFMDAAQPDEIFLVLSATTRLKDMLDIVKNYENIEFNRIIFTKIDETTTYGPILSLIYKTKKYLSYCTTGQSIPDDIEIADQRKLAQLILEDGGNNE